MPAHRLPIACPMSAAVSKIDHRDEVQRQAALDSYGVLDTSPEQAYDDIVMLASILCDTPAAAISLLDHGRQWSKARIGVDHAQSPRAQAICDVAIGDPERMLVVEDIAKDPRFSAMPIHIGQAPLRFYAAASLLSPDGYPLGVVCVMDVKPRQLSPSQRAGLKLLVRQTQNLFELRRHALEQDRLLSEHTEASRQYQQERAELEQRNETLQRTASLDQLTGLLNRTALAQLRGNPRAMQKLESAPYTLALLDVDLFKQVNDRHGHLLGDRALRVVADAVTASVREGDVAVRYGGEEFLVVLPNTGLAAAYEVAHRIRERVALASLPFALTVSVGIAAGDPSRDRPEQVFERADQALYQAKANGRDRVVADDTLQLGG